MSRSNPRFDPTRSGELRPPARVGQPQRYVATEEKRVIRALGFISLTLFASWALGADWGQSNPKDVKAFKAGNLEAVKRIFSKEDYFKDNPNVLMEAFGTAIESGNVALIEYLKERGWLEICHKEKGCLPIHFAAMVGRLNVVKYFIAEGFDVHALNLDGWHTWWGEPDGKSALHYAAGRGYLNVVVYLCKQGLDNKVRDKGGKTALDEANDSSQTRSSDPQEDFRLRTQIPKIIKYLGDKDCVKH